MHELGRKLQDAGLLVKKRAPKKIIAKFITCQRGTGSAGALSGPDTHA